MTLAGFERWLDTDAYAEYREYHEANIDGSDLDDVIHRTRQVIRYGESSKYYGKVTGYLARAVPAFRQNGPGQRTFGSQNVPKNVLAIRNWGFDVYGTYTG
jgi:hypothetical protein